MPVPVEMFPACVLALQMGWGSPCKIKQGELPDLLENLSVSCAWE